MLRENVLSEIVASVKNVEGIIMNFFGFQDKIPEEHRRDSLPPEHLALSFSDIGVKCRNLIAKDYADVLLQIPQFLMPLHRYYRGDKPEIFRHVLSDTFADIIQSSYSKQAPNPLQFRALEQLPGSPWFYIAHPGAARCMLRQKSSVVHIIEEFSLKRLPYQSLKDIPSWIEYTRAALRKVSEFLLSKGGFSSMLLYLTLQDLFPAEKMLPEGPIERLYNLRVVKCESLGTQELCDYHIDNAMDFVEQTFFPTFEPIDHEKIRKSLSKLNYTCSKLAEILLNPKLTEEFNYSELKEIRSSVLSFLMDPYVTVKFIRFLDSKLKSFGYPEPVNFEPAATPEQACGCCYATAVKLSSCAKCHITFYCSRDCQVSDWKTHKLVCCKSPVDPASPAADLISSMKITDNMDRFMDVYQCDIFTTDA